MPSAAVTSTQANAPATATISRDTPPINHSISALLTVTSPSSASSATPKSAATHTPHQPTPVTAPMPSTASAAPPTSPYSAVDLELHLHQTLDLCNKLAKADLVSLVPPASAATTETAMTSAHELAAAKMLNYCVRMLHADGWHPPTIIRAIVIHQSAAEPRGLRGTMYQALRERRAEMEEGRARKVKEDSDVSGQGTADNEGGFGGRAAGAKPRGKGRRGRKGSRGRGAVVNDNVAGLSAGLVELGNGAGSMMMQDRGCTVHEHGQGQGQGQLVSLI